MQKKESLSIKTGNGVILGVFCHPDDETSGAGGTFTKYARAGWEVYCVTATLGEEGTLGTGAMRLKREELPAAREAELRTVLSSYGANPPILLHYRDQQVKNAHFPELIDKVFSVIQAIKPNVLITFGPNGISGHEDHVTMHRAVVKAFQRYLLTATKETKLLYVAIPKSLVEDLNIPLDGPEANPNILIDITTTKDIKLNALRTYKSQEDAQELADMFERLEVTYEGFHQVYPALEPSHLTDDFTG